MRVTNLPRWPPPADELRQLPTVSTSSGKSWAVGEFFVGSGPSQHMVDMQRVLCVHLGTHLLKNQDPRRTAWTGLTPQ